MPDIIVAILLSIFAVGGGVLIGYDFCKGSNHEGSNRKDRLIGNDDLALIGADIITFAAWEDADRRKDERKAFIALNKASNVCRFKTDEEVEACAGKLFDERMADYDKRKEAGYAE